MGFSASLTLLSGIAAKANNSHILMSVLSFPIVISVLLIVIKVTKNCIDGLDRSVSTNDVDFKPSTTIEYGIEQFVNWYKEYYKIK